MVSVLKTDRHFFARRAKKMKPSGFASCTIGALYDPMDCFIRRMACFIQPDDETLFRFASQHEAASL